MKVIMEPIGTYLEGYLEKGVGQHGSVEVFIVWHAIAVLCKLPGVSHSKPGAAPQQQQQR